MLNVYSLEAKIEKCRAVEAQYSKLKLWVTWKSNSNKPRETTSTDVAVKDCETDQKDVAALFIQKWLLQKEKNTGMALLCSTITEQSTKPGP